MPATERMSAITLVPEDGNAGFLGDDEDRRIWGGFPFAPYSPIESAADEQAV